MELRVLFFTICCSVVCATIYRLVVCVTIYVQERLRNGGWRVSLRPPNKTRYRKCVEELSNLINELSDVSMKINIKQCQLLRSECQRLVHPPPPDSILKESFCAIRRAFKLMQDCCSENWILKAVEFGTCQRHFPEILLDLHRLPIAVNLIRFGGESLDDVATELRSIDISEETQLNLGEARGLDTAAFRDKLKTEGIHGCPDHCLADQLEVNPFPTQFKPAPYVIGRHVTEFDLYNPRIIHKGGDGICVFPVPFCDKEFVMKMRWSKSSAEVQEDIQLRNEAFFMKKCRHPYAVALLGAWEAQRTDCPRVPLLLMESMECDLDSVIKGNKTWWWWGGTGGFPALEAINLVLPVAKVLKYLHEIGVVHLDLKPKNILYTRVPGTQGRPDDVSVKLADFGVARMAEDRELGKAGTLGYMAPDMFMSTPGKSVDLVKADVFSFGLVFGEVLTGLSPMDALGCKNSPTKFYGKLQEGKQVPLPKKTPKFVKSIVESCLKLKPHERHSFDDICSKLQLLLLNGCT